MLHRLQRPNDGIEIDRFAREQLVELATIAVDHLLERRHDVFGTDGAEAGQVAGVKQWVGHGL